MWEDIEFGMWDETETTKRNTFDKNTLSQVIKKSDETEKNDW